MIVNMMILQENEHFMFNCLLSWL